jgi:hypothetical protein
MYREVVLVCGVTGSGKTVWTKQFTQRLNRLLVYDIALSFPVQYVDAETLADLVNNPPENFRYGVYSPYDTNVLTAAAYMLGNCWLVLEEISTLYNIGARINGPLLEAVLLGRQRSLSLIAISQRASYIPITLRSQASRIISFRQQEPADIKWLADFMGNDALKLPSLPDLHCIDWHKGKLSQYAIAIPKTTHIETDIPNDTPTDLAPESSPE